MLETAGEGGSKKAEKERAYPGNRSKPLKLKYIHIYRNSTMLFLFPLFLRVPPKGPSGASRSQNEFAEGRFGHAPA
jgi:hypothetical protein